MTVRTTEDYWRHIQLKHPEVSGLLSLIKETIKMPDLVRRSTKDQNILLFYRKINSYWLCVLVRCLGLDGFIVTSYLTDKIKRGEIIWPS